MHDKNRGRFWIAWATGLVFAAICVVANFLVSPVEKRADLTADRRYTLPEPIVRIARNFRSDEPCIVTVYLTEGLPQRFAHVGKALQTRLADLRRASNGGIEFSFVDPKGDEKLEEELTKKEIKPVPVQDLKAGSLTLANYYLSLEMRKGGAREIVHLAELGGQILSDEEATLSAMADFLAARLVKLANPDTIVGIVSEKKIGPSQPGQNAEPTDSLKAMRDRLAKHAKVQDVQIKNGMPVPDAIKALILHRPENLTELELFQLDQFVMKGGRLIVLLDNWSTYEADREGAVAQAMLRQLQYSLRECKSGMNDWLAHFGFKVEPGLVHDASLFRGQIMTQGPGGLPMMQTLAFPGVVNVRATDDDKKATGQVSEEEPAVAGLAPLPFVLPAPMRLDDDAAFLARHPAGRLASLLRASPGAWAVTDVQTALSMTNVQPPAKTEGGFTLAARADGALKSFFADRDPPFREGTPEEMRPKREATVRECASDRPGQIWVVADADFALDVWGSIAQRLGSAPLLQALAKSQAMLMNVVDASAFGNELVDVRRQRLMDRSVNAEKVAEDRGWILFSNIFLIPLALAVFGLLRWWWRSVATFVASPRQPVDVGSKASPPSPPSTHDGHGSGDGHGGHGHGAAHGASPAHGAHA